MHRQGAPVERGVLAREPGIVGLELEPVHLQAFDPGRQAERRGARAAAEIEHGIAGPGRHGGRHQDGVRRRAIAAHRLPDAHAPAEKAVLCDLRTLGRKRHSQASRS